MYDEVESAQLSIFLRELAPLNAMQVWSAAFSQQPTAFQTLPNGQTVIEGDVDGTHLQFVVQPARLDIVARGPESEKPVPTGLANVDHALTLIRDVVVKLAPNLAIGRVACVTQAFKASESAAMALEFALKVLGDEKKPYQEEVMSQSVFRRSSTLRPGNVLTLLYRVQNVTIQFFQILPGQARIAAGQGAPTSFLTQLYSDVFFEHMHSTALTEEELKLSLEEVCGTSMKVLREGFNGIN